MKNYDEVTEWLFSQLPVYQNQGAKAYKPGLGKIEAFARHLGNPHASFPSVHVAGTNGKGSTSHMIAAALQAMGFKVGIYTSPHLLDFSERIRVNGKVVSKDFVVDFVVRHKDYFIAEQLSFFEITVGMAFAYFAKVKVDYAVVEVGLGGRLDATNIIRPQLSVITNIGLDHTEFLGDSLAKIAFEKAGIIKENTTVVIGETTNETRPVFEKKASEENAPLVFAEQCAVPDFPTDLVGGYQEKNRQTAYVALETLLGTSVPKTALEGFKNVGATTGLRGRWEQLATAPDIVVDVTHNAEGFKYVVEQLEKIECDVVHLVLGFVKGKNVPEILAMLPKAAQLYLCAPAIARALPVTEAAQEASRLGSSFTVYGSSNEAFAAARENAKKEDFIFVGGSTFLVAEILSRRSL